MARMKATKLISALCEFEDTIQLYYHPFYEQYKYTAGVQFLAQNGGCYWLIEFIFMHQTDPELRGEEFQVWKIEVDDCRAKITVDDGNTNILKVFHIEYTNFPLVIYKLWLIGDMLLIPTEFI